MNQSLKIGLMSLLLGSSVYAANPVQGWYAGIMLGGSYAPSVSGNLYSPAYPLAPGIAIPAFTIPAKLKYGGYGNIGGQLGYRFFDHFRVEGELMGNKNPYKKLTIGTDVITAPNSSTTLRMKGGTTTGAFLVNGFYDFFTPSADSAFSTYVGLGVGYANVSDTLKFYYNNVYISGSRFKASTNSAVAQGIIGMGYFLDDFTWFGLDFRYLTSKRIPATDSPLQVASINLLFNGTFCGV